MEDPDVDWEIEEDPYVDWKIEEDPYVDWKKMEYSSSSDYLEDVGKSNMKWILEKGLSIGKKVVITGFVVSSAPLVLPSIVIVSAVGFAVSVPFGLVYASYACTRELMNKLLPLPTSSHMLHYDIMSEDEKERNGEPIEKVGIEYINMEEEEREQMEDIREGIEKRIELVMDENELPEQDGDNLKDIRKDEETGVRYESWLAQEEVDLLEDNRNNEGVGGRIELGKEENKSQDNDMEDISQYEGIEKKIELVMHENKLPQEDDDDLKDIRTDKEERLASGDGSFKEKGYEEDVDESLVVKEDASGELIDEKSQGQGLEGNDESIVEKRKGEELLPKAKRIVVMIGGEKTSSDGKPEGSVVVVRRVLGETRDSKRETENEEENVGLLGKIRDQGDASDAAKKEKKKKKKKNKGVAGKSRVEGKYSHRNVEIVKELENPIETENEHPETFVHMAEGDDEKETRTSPDEYKENVIETGSILDVKNKKLQEVVVEVIGSDRMNGDKKQLKENSTEQEGATEDNFGSAVKEVEPAIEMEGILLEKRDAGKSDNIVSGELTMHYSKLVNGKQPAEYGHSLLEEKQKPVQSNEVMVQQQGTGRDVDTDLYKDLIPEKEEIVVYRNGVTRETTDNLADQKFRDEKYQGESAASYGRATEHLLNEKVDVVEIPVASRPPKPKHDGQTSLQDFISSPRKASAIGDHKTWEQIDALRTIVGYRTIPHRSCIEEVKALYIFTGVEPPSSFESTTSSAELSDMLRFLMSIVGVK